MTAEDIPWRDGLTDKAAAASASLGSALHEKRAHARNELTLPVVCTTEGGATIHGRTRDLSIGGAFVCTTEVPAFGSRVTMRFSSPTSGEVALQGIVRWTKDEGFGLQFQLLSAKETYAIAKLLSP